jgi:hypothetical protein
MINLEFKKAEDVAKAISELTKIEISLECNKIYKKAGKKFIKLNEKLGTLFCNKTNKLSRISFIESVQSNGANNSIIYLKN